MTTAQQTMTTAQQRYEADVALRPTYPDGGPRMAWHELPDYARASWARPLRAEVDALAKVIP